MASNRKTTTSHISKRSQAQSDKRDRLALDISLLKKQYAKLRERQRQAHIILTNTSKQSANPPTSNPNNNNNSKNNNNNNNNLHINQYLLGRNAIVSSKGRRSGPPVGAIPPARVVSIAQSSKSGSSPATARQQKRARHISDIKTKSENKRSTTDGLLPDGSDIRYNLHKSPSAASSLSSVSSSSETAAATSKKTRVRKKSESSSYSEDSDDDNYGIDAEYEDDDDADFVDNSSSTSTSLCDEHIPNISSSVEASPLKASKGSTASTSTDQSRCSSASANVDNLKELAPGSPKKSTDYTKLECEDDVNASNNDEAGDDELFFHSKEMNQQIMDITKLMHQKSSERSDDNHSVGDQDSDNETYGESFKKTSPSSYKVKGAIGQQITSTSQLSPIADIAKFLSASSISPLKTPATYLIPQYPLPDFKTLEFISMPNMQQEAGDKFDKGKGSFRDLFKVNDEGVINEYFERINQVSDRPNRLELSETTSEPLSKANAFKQSDAPVLPTETTRKHKETVVPSPNKLPSPLMPKAYAKDDYGPLQSDKMDKGATEEETNFQFNYLKEKSISLDDTHKLDKNPEPNRLADGQNRVSPTSCPEQSDSNTYRVLQIIEENSKILKRIMNKDPELSNNEDDDGSLQRRSKVRERSSERKLSPIPKTKAECLEYFETSELRRRKSLEKSLTQSELVKIGALEGEHDSHVEKNLSLSIEDELPTLSQSKAGSPSLVSFRNDIGKETKDDLSVGHSEDGSTMKESSFNEYISSLISSLSETSDDETGTKDGKSDKQSIKRYRSKGKISEQNLRHSANVEDLYRNVEKEILFLERPVSTESLAVSPQRTIDFTKFTFDGDRLDKPRTPLYDKTEYSEKDKYLSNECSDVEKISENKETHARLSSINLISDISEEPKHKYGLVGLATDAKASGSAYDDAPDSDVSATISSIKNTIKSIDSLCEDDKRRSRERTDKTLSEIIKVVEQLEEDKDKITKRNRSTLPNKSPVSVVIDAALPVEQSFLEMGTRELPHRSEQKSPRHLPSSSRFSRDRRRDISPRQRVVTKDDFNEYESRVRRDTDLSTLNDDRLRFSGSTGNINLFAGDSSKSEYETSAKLSPYKSNEKFEIRHTTVTATLYDRYLSQKKERESKMEKSPPPQIITKSYLDSLKLPTVSLPYQLSSDSRNSKSAENSPSRGNNNNNNNEFTKYMIMPHTVLRTDVL